MDNKKTFADNLNLIWKFYKDHCDTEPKNDAFFEQLNEDYKSLIASTEQKYKVLIEKGGLAAMEILHEERNDNGQKNI